jgi:GT2 family glycosyltransferase
MDDALSVAIAIPTIAAHGLLDRCLASVTGQRGVQPDVLIIQNGPKVAASCLHWERHGIAVHRPGRNLGVPCSWNFACRWAWGRGHRAVLLLNDDVELVDPDTLAHLRSAVAGDARAVYLLAGRGFAAVYLSQLVWDEVGPFDEGFWPGYFEDDDMRMRLKLAGIPSHELSRPVRHEVAATIGNDDLLRAIYHGSFRVNWRRYVAKWGGSPGEETFTVPWNGRPPWPPGSVERATITVMRRTAYAMYRDTRR